MATKVAGRKDVAQGICDLLRKVGFAPISVTVLGVFVHVEFRTKTKAEECARFMMREKAFSLCNITCKNELNAGETGGYGSKYHKVYTAHMKA